MSLPAITETATQSLKYACASSHSAASGAKDARPRLPNATEASGSYWTPGIINPQYRPAAEGVFLLATLQSSQLMPGIPAADESKVAYLLQVGDLPKRPDACRAKLRRITQVCSHDGVWADHSEDGMGALALHPLTHQCIVIAIRHGASARHWCLSC